MLNCFKINLNAEEIYRGNNMQYINERFNTYNVLDLNYSQIQIFVESEISPGAGSVCFVNELKHWHRINDFGSKIPKECLI